MKDCSFINGITFSLLFLGLTSQVADAAQYYCGPVGKSYYSHEQLFDLGNDLNSCEIWNNDFSKKASPNSYEDCIKKYNNKLSLYKSGKCVPVVERIHRYPGHICKVLYIPQMQQVVYTTCQGKEANKYTEIVKKLYK